MSTITLGQYLFERLHQLKVDSVFGVPGDFNLRLLDDIDEVPGMRWIGNANELNAAYAADGYSRVKGLGALVTTFGVGELSALNGIAGAYAEHVGLIHIVGVPAVSSQQKQLLLHHTLGNGDFSVFYRMSKEISHASSFLKDAASGPSEIDRLLRDAYIYQKPVYLGLPANLVTAPVERSLLDTPIDLELQPNNQEVESDFIEDILKMIKDAKNPVILVDACATRHSVKLETKQLIEATKFPVFVTPMGKGAVDENNPRFGGVYVGSLSNPDVGQAVESADLVLSVGGLLSDFNTGSFSYSYKTKNIVEFHSDYCKIRSAVYPGLQMKFVLQKLLKLVGAAAKGYTPVPVPSVKLINTPAPQGTLLNQQWLWTKVSSFFREGDIVITETGTSAFGIVQSRFPKNTTGISQVLWGSIGYTGGSVLGAVLAAQEVDPTKRVILFIGDGSLQLTVQEISTMCKWGQTPYLFVLNNNGYTIERLIHGMNAEYNAIQPWNHLDLLKFFNAKKSESIRVSTTGEVDQLFADPAFNKNDKIRLIEVMLPMQDAPINLVRQAQLSEKTNSSA
ncbi:hypothetical protein PACTADRAFT_53720 [Pachysolen tannophilus NRRL Y-2460]|uniref:Pyruvate decarboxylase n=1 Tax=Pachysolen tannophilus NRRL Y-2460 TaxID=669874 RepID=A0A1E4U2W9_PACTA|nr:hypothetical protein PACTADRAFT_53720 [Pachysolen tannophilus NRRL Y-2460]